MNEDTTPNLGYFLMIFVAGFVSVYDNVMNVVYMRTLASDEENPVCLRIIESLGVEGLVLIKAISTICAVVLMCALVYTKFRIAIVPIFVFQVLFFLYLNFYASTGMMWAHDWYRGLQSFIEFYWYKCFG